MDQDDNTHAFATVGQATSAGGKEGMQDTDFSVIRQKRKRKMESF